MEKAPGRGREGGTLHVNSAGVRSWWPHSALAGRSCTDTSSNFHRKALSRPRLTMESDPAPPKAPPLDEEGEEKGEKKAKKEKKEKARQAASRLLLKRDASI